MSHMCGKIDCIKKINNLNNQANVLEDFVAIVETNMLSDTSGWLEASATKHI